eukprot:XP_011671284.1 PREDICTED: Williams-Beuren syndrome chromosomal region 27 protein-like [Strongylocentrotus purpuratus]
MATIAENVISKYSSDESVQQKVDKVRALHGLKDHREVEEVYDELAGNYDELVTSLEYSGPFFTSRTVSKIETKTDAKMLDVACGTGLIGDELHKLGYTQIVGTDLSQSSLDVLARKGSYTKSVHANFGPSTPLDFDDGKLIGSYYSTVTLHSEWFPCIVSIVIPVS